MFVNELKEKKQFVSVAGEDDIEKPNYSEDVFVFFLLKVKQYKISHVEDLNSQFAPDLQ